MYVQIISGCWAAYLLRSASTSWGMCPAVCSHNPCSNPFRALSLTTSIPGPGRLSLHAVQRSQISAQVPPLVAGVAGADALADVVVAGDAVRAVDVASSLRRWLCWVVGWGVGMGVLCWYPLVCLAHALWCEWVGAWGWGWCGWRAHWCAAVAGVVSVCVCVCVCIECCVLPDSVVGHRVRPRSYASAVLNIYIRSLSDRWRRWWG